MGPTVGTMYAFFMCVGALGGRWQLAVTSLVLLATITVGLFLVMVNNVWVVVEVTRAGVTVVVGLIVVAATVVVDTANVELVTSI